MQINGIKIYSVHTNTQTYTDKKKISSRHNKQQKVDNVQMRRQSRAAKIQ